MSPLRALVAVGEGLYGSRWRSPLARALRRPDGDGPGVDLRLLQRWLTGERPTPDWLRDALVDLVRRTARERASTLERLVLRIAA